MGSVANLYATNEERNNCYSCPRRNAEIEVAGKAQKMECRTYNRFGLTIETMASADMTELVDKRLIQVIPIGVDTAEFSNENQLDYNIQSRGGGGLSKYQCGADYQVPKMIKHKKLAYTEMLYVHSDMCMKQFISSEYQDWAFPNDRLRDATTTPTMFSDGMISAARMNMAKAINQVDVIGVFGGGNAEANMYDGILAQAYWAYSRNAYFHSVELTIDETDLIDGTFLHAKYAGSEIDIEFDSTQPSDASIERYETRAEVYERLVNWLNNEVLTEGGRKYVDATYYQNTIIVTSKWTAEWIELQVAISADATIDWLNCDSATGVASNTIQGVMPIDERPFLVKYQRYTEDNVLTALPMDIHTAIKDIDNRWLKAGQTWGLYIDEHILRKYKFAIGQRNVNQPQGDYLMETFGENVYPLSSLSGFGGTGLWFVSAIDASGNTPALRNIKHVVDSTSAAVSSPRLWVDEDCGTVKMKYE